MIKPYAKAWIAFVGTLALVAVQTALVELELSGTARGWLMIVQAVLVAGTTSAVFMVKNRPELTELTELPDVVVRDDAPTSHRADRWRTNDPRE